MKAPFTFFGGKALIAKKIWSILGQPDHYLEPFFGSGAVLLARPDYNRVYTETVNDRDGFISNVWRAIQYHPDETARWCDWPVNHCDLMARRKTLLKNEEFLLKNLIDDDMWCDPKLAGYWIWAASCWIGSGLTCTNAIPRIGDKGSGVHSTRLDNKCQIPHLSDKGVGVHRNVDIYDWFRVLSERLRYVRVVCGDWSRICGGNWQDNSWKIVGIFFDPPYGVIAGRDNSLYHCESQTVSLDVEAWCIERGSRKNHRIVIAGYDTEYASLVDAGWTIHEWCANGGYGKLGNGKGKKNRHRERLFISPHCSEQQQKLPFID